MVDRIIDAAVPLIYLVVFFPVPLYFIKLLRQMKNPTSPQAQIIEAARENNELIRTNNLLLRELIELNRHYSEHAKP